ncbi:tail fiber assembly protein [Pantoea sp.]|uniref:tail fiber assembly protein n=1 Tax=Pantoea sp. TaxID=69393 RepID=UPI0031D6FB85
MDEARQIISVLQDAVDLEMAIDRKSKALPSWKKYRVLLSRVDANTTQENKRSQKRECGLQKKLFFLCNDSHYRMPDLFNRKFDRVIHDHPQRYC